jgi:hypothetical protein
MNSTDISVKCRWRDSLDRISVADWEKIFGSRAIRSYNLFLSMQQAGFPEVSFYYLEIFSDTEVLSILPCFTYCLDLLDILEAAKMKGLAGRIRKVLPGFLKMRTFVTGSYMATCESFVEIRGNISAADKKEVKVIIERELKKKAGETKASITIVKDIRESQMEKAKDLLPEDFHFFDFFPTTVIPVGGECSPYPVVLKKKNRKRCKKYRALFQSSFEWEVVRDFEPHTELFGKLYLNVLNKAKNRFEVLNASFFSKLNAYLPDNSFLLVARDKATGQVRLMEVVLEEEDRLLPLYLGIEYSTDDTKVLYLNAIFRTVEEAEKRKKAFVEFGQTSYYPKVMSGAMAENIYYGFHSNKRLVRYVIRHFFKGLFQPVPVPEPVYLAGMETYIRTKLMEYGIRLR